MSSSVTIFAAENGNKPSDNPTSSDAQSTKIIINHVDQTLYNSNDSQDGYTMAVLRGRVDISYNNYSILADQVILKFRNQEAVFLIAQGDVLLKQKDFMMASKELFVDIKKKNLTFVDGFTFQKNIFMGGGEINLREKEIESITNLYATTSHYLYPHYQINGQQGWIEKNNDLLFTGVSLKIGQNSLLYFPVFYNTDYGTGILSAISFNPYVGVMFNNTYKEEDSNSKENFMFDYYQRLGFYLGNNYTRTDVGNLNLHLGFAYDRHILYKNGISQNYFEQIVGQGPSSGRSFRYNINLLYQGTLYQAPSDDPSQTSIFFKGSVKEMSDPLFLKQFEENRKDDFNPKNLLFSRPDVDWRTALSAGGLINVQGRLIDTLLTYSFYGYNIELGETMYYVLSPRTATSGSSFINSFAADYYHNTLKLKTLPTLDITKIFDLYNVNILTGKNSQFSLQGNIDFDYRFLNTDSYQPEGLENSELSHSFTITFSNALIYTKGIFSFNWPLIISNELDYGGYGYYDYTNKSQLTSYNHRLNVDTKLEYTPNLIWTINNLVFKSSTTLQTLFQNQNQNTLNANEDQDLNDRTNSYFDFQQKVGEYLSASWKGLTNSLFNGYVYVSYLYLNAQHKGDRLPSEQHSKLDRATYDADLYLFNTLFSLSTYDQKGTTILKQNEKSPLEIKLTSNLIPYLNLINSYSWDRFNERSSTNVFELNLKIPLRMNVVKNFWFDNINIDLLWSRDYVDNTLDYLIYKLAFQFNITNLFQLTLDLKGRNYRLYLYTASANNLRISFWKDFLKSLMIWSIKDRQESNFKMESFGLSISHDLDEWVLKIGAELAPKLSRTGAYYFQSEFYFEILLKELDMLSAPRIQLYKGEGSF